MLCFLVIFCVLLGKDFKYYVQCFLAKCFSGVLKVQTKFGLQKTSLSVSRQDFVEHGGRVISAAKQPEILHVPLVATNDLLSESPNSIFGTSFFLRQIIFVPHKQQIGRHLHKDLSLDEKTMTHVYVIVSRIYGRLFLYLINSKSDATYPRTYLLMRKQCLMFMLLSAASTADYFCTS